MTNGFVTLRSNITILVLVLVAAVGLAAVPHWLDGRVRAATTARVLYGEWNPSWQTNIQGQADNTVITTRDADMGHQLDIIHWYASSTEGYTTYDHRLVDSAHQLGRIPFISWGLPVGFNNTAILDDWANGIKAADSPVYIRLFWEFNDPPNSVNSTWDVCNGSHSPAQLVSSWQFIVNRFRADGATNVKWVWNPDGTMGSQMWGNQCGSLAAAYPGDSYVDFRGFDTYGYNNQAQYDAENVQTGSTKPMLLGETNARDSSGGPAWVGDLSNRVQAAGSMNQVAAVVWFNDGRNGSYSFATNPNTKAAVKAMLQTAAFQAPQQSQPATKLICPVVVNPQVGQKITCTYN